MPPAAESASKELQKFVGQSIDGLRLSDRWRLSGYWTATELYSPQRLPRRIIQAVGTSARDCIEQLRQRGLDPARFEFEPVSQPYRP